MNLRSAQHGRVAHFLIDSVLAESPPNEALISGWCELGYSVDVYAPTQPDVSRYAGKVTALVFPHGYGWRSSLKAQPRLFGRRYCAFSATAENPYVVAWLAARLARRPFIALLDEIHSGSYWGDRSPRWKRTVMASIRDSALCIVNDESRIPLVTEYAGTPKRIIVYPGAYRCPPEADRAAERARYGFREEDVVLGLSGGLNLTSGFDWALDSLSAVPELKLLIQPVNLNPLENHLLQSHRHRDRMFIESRRLGWQEAWTSAVACDFGLAVYLNPAPQFQNMGIASNRLCMFLCMGVPVIASRQPSFEFIERYDCGALIASAAELPEVINALRSRLPELRANALRAAREYVRADERYGELVDTLHATMKPWLS